MKCALIILLIAKYILLLKTFYSMHFTYIVCKMHKILSLVFIVLHWYIPELIVWNYIPILFHLIFLGGGCYFVCFINPPLRGVMWNMQGAEQNYFALGLFACLQWKVLKCISYVCFASCLSMCLYVTDGEPINRFSLRLITGSY